MTHEVLVGVDVGTTSIKALAVTPAGRVVGEASAPTPWRHDGPWADADARELAAAAIGVCAAAVSEAGTVSVRAIGVTGIAESGALIDRAGEPCAPVLAWFDPRGDASAVRAAVTRASSVRSSTFGTISAASTPMMTNTTSSSIRVKPRRSAPRQRGTGTRIMRGATPWRRPGNESY